MKKNIKRQKKNKCINDSFAKKNHLYKTDQMINRT